MSASGPKRLEPIAVIGLACRFPGASSGEAYWRLLREGEEAISEVPPDRWDIDEYYHPRAGVSGRMISRRGGFLDDIDLFDAEFFGISPREAERLDPQQRLLLEVAWEALEDAGMAAPRLKGTKTGVFIGLSSNDYWRTVMESESGDTYLATGNAGSVASNRISYYFDWAGPSLSIDTACSSALVAVHLACRSLWDGESSLALAGGVNAILSPVSSVSFSQAGMLSPDGRCNTFDASANGYVRGEGCGLVFLKPLSIAETDGDRVYALIRGTATNQDGRTSGLTVPSEAAQEAVILDACRTAGVEPRDVDYVEAHGTGTPVGDPIEARGLGRAFSRERKKDAPLLVGSCKTNVGHLESAAGIAGIIKTVLALEHGEIPASLNFRDPNPEIPFEELRLRVASKRGRWPRRDRPNLAGVNSFGFGGANAHAVLEQYVPSGAPETPQRRACLRDLELVTLSAHRPEALRDMASRWADFIARESSGGWTLHEVAHTAGARRTHHEHRLAIVVRSKDELVDALSAHAREESRPDSLTGSAADSRGLAFVFTGQGPQWWGMGRRLLTSHPDYREAVERCDDAFRVRAGWSILDALLADESSSRLHETAVAQPCLFALQVGLARVWESLGVTPDAVVGHSVGEVAAFHVAGALDLEGSVEVLYHRSRLMGQAAGKGRMAAVDLSAEEMAPYLEGCRGVDLAAVNAPSSVVLSGDVEPLDELLERLREHEVFYRYLPVDYAFHSHQMEPYAFELGESLQSLEARGSSLHVYSTVTGAVSRNPDFGARYWTANLRQTVRFREAIAALIADGYRRFVEIGPHPTLTGSISQSLTEASEPGMAVSTLRRGEDDEREILKALGMLYATGHTVEWSKLYPGNPRRVPLPHYPWQRERHWLGGKPARKDDRAEHRLAGRRIDAAQPTFRLDLGVRRLEYLRDHRVQQSPLLPAAAYVEMALSAAAAAKGPSARALTDVDFRAPLSLPESDDSPSPLVEIVLRPGAADSLGFQISSRAAKDGAGDPGSWRLHAEGSVQSLDTSAAETGAEMSLRELRARLTESVPVEPFYDRLARAGLDYGPAFRGISDLWRGRGEALARLSQPASLDDGPSSYLVHPSLLDAAFQALAAATDEQSGGLYLPIGIERVRLHERVSAQVWAYVRLRPGLLRHGGVVEADVSLVDPDGRVQLTVSGLRLSRLDATSATGASLEEINYDLAWELLPRPGRSRAVASPDTLPAPSEIARRIEAVRDATARRRDLDRFDRRAVDRLADAYIVEALGSLGWGGERENGWTLEQIEAHLEIHPRYRRLLERYLGRLQESGCIEARDGRFRRLRSEGTSVSLRRHLIAAHPSTRADLDMMDACGAHLAEILKGTVDPLELLFPDGSLEEAERWYHESAVFWVYNRLVAEAVAMVLARLPQDRIVRILEVGAGTGSTTSQVLSVVPPGRARYAITDISPAFVAHATARFGELPFVRSAVLDVEKDPLLQGFDEHSFDIILAPSVLHATADLRVVLQNLQRLLTDRGLLIALELIDDIPVSDIAFAPTEGWWRFTDSELRTERPLLSDARWVELLEKLGFTDAVAAPREPIRQSALSIIIARGPSLEMPQPAEVPIFPDESVGTWLVFADDGEAPEALLEMLTARSNRCVRVRSGAHYEELDDESFVVDPSRIEDYVQVLARATESDPPLRGVLYHFRPSESWLEKDEDSTLEAAVARCLGSAMHLAQSLVRLGSAAPRLFFVTQRVAAIEGVPSAAAVIASGLSAFAAVLGTEHPELRATAVDLSAEPTREEVESLVEELGVEYAERDVALRGPSRYVRRLIRHAPEPVSSGGAGSTDIDFALEVSRPGRLDTIGFFESRIAPPGPGEIEIRVEAAALNFLDVLFAMGLYPGQAPGESVQGLGMECAGVVTAVGEGVDDFRPGDAVIALAPGSYASRVVTRAELAAAKPEAMTYEHAATIPVAFLTAQYALGTHGRLRRGERVLVHSASGGVGLAAVQLAKLRGAELFVTAGSPAKREYLSALGIEHVMDSRSLRFRDDVERITDGEGVDVVLNSLPGEALAASLSLLRSNGRFLEIGKRDIYENRPLGMRALKNNVSFSAIDLIPISTREPELLGALLREIVPLFEDGRLRPLPYVSFPWEEAEDAFRYMAQAKHIGKVVLTTHGRGVSVLPRKTAGSLTCREDGTYLITGGLGGFGLLVAEWLVEAGARHLVLVGRNLPTDEATRKKLDRLRHAGARVTPMAADVSKPEDVAAVLGRIEKEMPALRGVFHAAMVLEDAAFRHLTVASLRRVMAPKLTGAWLLHRATQALALDIFVLFSSAARVVGSPGQGSYVAANACIDALAYHRRAMGLPATTIDWGGIGDVGYVSRNDEARKFLESIGMRTIPGRRAIEALDAALSEGATQRVVVDADWSVVQHLMKNPLYSELLLPDASEGGAGSEDSFRARVLESPAAERQDLLESHLRHQLSRILQLEASRIPVNKPLTSLGLDSLMAYELKGRIESDMGVQLPMMKLVEGPSLSALASVLLAELADDTVLAVERGRDAEPLEAGEGKEQDEVVAGLDHLSDEQVDSMLSDLVGRIDDRVEEK